MFLSLTIIHIAHNSPLLSSNKAILSLNNKLCFKYNQSVHKVWPVLFANLLVFERVPEIFVKAGVQV